MINFKCVPIEAGVAARFKRSGTDDGGNPIRRVVASADAGAPCRVCLNYAEPGQTMLLGSYHLPRPRGIYWTPSPIFVHEDACEGFDQDGVLAPIVRENSLVSLRSYDADDLCLYDLGAVCAAEAIDAALERALADERTSFVSVHTARPGCLLCRIEKIDSRSDRLEGGGS